MEQRERRSRKPESELSNLFLQQSPAVFSAPDGQQCQRSGCHVLRGAAEEEMDFRIFCCSFVPISWKWNFRSDQGRIGSSLHILAARPCRELHRAFNRGLKFLCMIRCVYKIYNLRVHYFVNVFVPFLNLFLKDLHAEGEKTVFQLLKDFCTSRERMQQMCADIGKCYSAAFASLVMLFEKKLSCTCAFSTFCFLLIFV